MTPHEQAILNAERALNEAKAARINARHELNQELHMVIEQVKRHHKPILARMWENELKARDMLREAKEQYKQSLRAAAHALTPEQDRAIDEALGITVSPDGAVRVDATVALQQPRVQADLDAVSKIRKSQS